LHGKEQSAAGRLATAGRPKWKPLSTRLGATARKFSFRSVEFLATTATIVAEPCGLLGTSEPCSPVLYPHEQLVVGHGLKATRLLRDGHQFV
jgi:hypothetical protein